MNDYKDRVSGWATDIDRSKAPEGFPIWIEDLNPGKGFDCSGWHRDDGDRYTNENGKYWPKLKEGIYRVHSPAPQWNGEGLPPAGCECEYFAKSENRWIPVVMIGVFRGELVLGCEETGVTGQLDSSEYQLRPRRTPAQIAAEEREATIEQILSDYEYTVGTCTHALARSQAARIYDAGYRKIKGDDK